MSERLNNSDQPDDEGKSLEEKYNETKRAIAQTEADRQKLDPMFQDFRIAQSSLFRILGRGERSEALEGTPGADGEPQPHPIEIVYAYENLLKKLDELLRQEYLDGHSRLSSLSFELFKEEQAKTTENTPTEPENQ